MSSIDYAVEYNNLIGELIPEWFFTLSASTRNVILATTYNEYVSVTSTKNDAYVAYFADLIQPYAPPSI